MGPTMIVKYTTVPNKTMNTAHSLSRNNPMNPPIVQRYTTIHNKIKNNPMKISNEDLYLKKACILVRKELVMTNPSGNSLGFLPIKFKIGRVSGERYKFTMPLT